MEKLELLELYPSVEDLPTEREELEEIATSLEVSFRANTGDDTIKNRIAEVLYDEESDEDEEELSLEVVHKEASQLNDHGFEITKVSKDKNEIESFTVVNQRKNRLSIKGVEVESKGTYTLSAADLKNEKLMKKINHAIAIGVLKKV